MAKQKSDEIELIVTPPDEWRRPRAKGTLRRLESTGRVVRWKPLDLLDLLAEGQIPDLLTPEVMRVTWSDFKDERNENERAIDWINLLNYVTKLALLEPVVVDAPQNDGEITPQELLRTERLEIFYLVTNPVKELFPFRPRQEVDVGSLSPGESDGESAT